MTEAKYIPIERAKEIAKKYGYDQVIILALNNAKNTQSVVTFGKSIVDSDQAAQGGNYIKKKFLGWPKSECLAEPARVRRLKKRLKQIAEIIERVDHRCMFGAVVTPTRQEIRESEIKKIYKLAKGSK